mmetsp:Transcript_22252/g.89831  ORF Transcript_22252/g.89831 Transcript_22252/m.89831 type:complete len:410 (-) Transcript_22252:269-1498(-)
MRMETVTKLMIVVCCIFYIGAYGHIQLNCTDSLNDQVTNAAENVHLSGAGCHWNLTDMVVVGKPMKLSDISVTVVPGAAINAIRIMADGVTIENLNAVGNLGTVDPSERAALLEIKGSNFLIDGANFYNSSRDGIECRANNTEQAVPVRNGIIRNIYGNGNRSDTVKISTGNLGLTKTYNITVENVVAENCPITASNGNTSGTAQYGAVEVTDGSQEITVKNVQAYNCRYGMVIQDHGNPDQVNHNIWASNISAEDSVYAVVTELNDFGHSNVTVANVTATRVQNPVYMFYLTNVTFSDVTIVNSTTTSSTVALDNVNNFSLEKVRVKGGSPASAVVSVKGSTNVSLSDIYPKKTTRFNYGVVIVAQSAADASSVSVTDSNFQYVLNSPPVHVRISDSVTGRRSRVHVK